jgi:small neutral amino acid transporter SnatA (MarC family)
VSGSIWLALVAIVAVVNPPRLAPALGNLTPLLADSTSIRRARAVAVGTLGAGGVAVALGLVAVISDGLLDAIDVSAATMRVAAGLVLILAVLRDVVAGRPAAEPALAGWGAALVPVAIPFVARPELAILVVSVATVEGLAASLVGLMLVILGVAVFAVPIAPGPARRAVDWAGWVLMATCATAGVAIAVDGIYGV